MEQFMDALKQSPAERTFIPGIAIPDMFREWKGMGENMLKSLIDYVSDLESREQKISVATDSLEKRLKDLEEKERNFELFQQGRNRVLAFRERLLSPMCEDFKEEVQLRERKLDEQLKLVEDHIESLELAHAEVHGLRLLELEKLKEIEKREKHIDSMAWSLEKRLREIEQREKQSNLSQDEKLRELVSKETLLSRKREDFVKEVRFANEKLRDRDELCCGVIERLDSSLKLLEGMKVTIDGKFKEIKSWETMAHKSLILILNEADLIRESLERRFTECEEMEREFNTLHEERLKILDVKERKLHNMRRTLLKETLALKNTNGSLNEAYLVRDSLEKRFEEFEEIEKDFNSVQEDKIQKLELKRIQMLDVEIQKLDNQTLEILEEILSKKVKEIESREVSLNVACEALTIRTKDARSSQESANIRLQELQKSEKEFQLYRDRKMRELELAEEKLRLIGKEFLDEVISREEKFDMQDKMMHGLLERLEFAHKNIKHMNALVGQRFKEIEHNHTKAKAMKEEEDIEKIEEQENEGKKNDVDSKDFMKNLELNKLDQPDRFLIERPDCNLREIESNGKQNYVLNECGYKQAQSTDGLNTRFTVESDHLKCSIRVDGKTLEMLINDTEKESELIGAEVFKLLLRCSDPEKLVLDAIEAFYVPHLGRGDVEVNVKRKIILVLDQLTKMSPSIQPYVREAAIKLACIWKSKMSVAENSLEVLGFLHFLAAYSLASYFDKNELVSLLKTVAYHKQTPELCRILGLSEKIPGFIQSLINEKRYLLASTYIHESGLDYMFPQAAVLNYYVQHLKAKCRRERTSSQSKDKVFASEIGDLRIAIEHIIKYGLESEYSPDIINTRIKQLQCNRASFLRMRYKTSQERQHNAARKASPVSENKPFSQNCHEIESSQVKKLVNEVPKTRPNNTSKRRKLTRAWVEGHA